MLIDIGKKVAGHAEVELLVKPAPANEVSRHRGPVQLGPQDRVVAVGAL